MKNLFIILLSILSVLGLAAQAQTKKPTTKSVTVSKKAPAKAVTTAKATPAKAIATSKSPEKKEAEVAAKATNQSVKQRKSSAATNGYKAAIGLKFIYGVSLTGKVFIKENSALEGILRYNSAGGFGSNIAFTGLYEYHAPINTVAGLRWYLGGGGYVNYFSWKDNNVDAVTTFGVAGIIGLEYKFANLPLAISADWQPAYIISAPSGFSAENGGIGLKYTF